MARKRGGLAGIWDRNKHIIKPAASVLAGVVGTPALGAAVGAGLSGLDREGKRGIGFDVGQGLKGAATGYALGSLGSGAAKAFGGAGKVRSLIGLGRGNAPAAISTAPAAVAAAPSAASSVAPLGTAAKVASKAAKAGGWLKNAQNAQTAVSGLATVAGLADARGERAAQREQSALQEREVALRERTAADERADLERRRQSAAQLLPLLLAGMNGSNTVTAPDGRPLTIWEILAQGKTPGGPPAIGAQGAA